jgi:transcriptional regulator with XRE-family HTH domain
MVELSPPTGYLPGVLRPSQCRAARALLGWTQAELAGRAGIKVLVLRRFETGQTDPRASTRDRIERALLDAGIMLTDNDSIGVTLRRRP